MNASKKASSSTITTKDKNITQFDNENFLSFKEYSAISKYKKFSKKLQNKKGSMLNMKKLIPSIMPHTLEIKSDYKARNEL